MGGELAREGCAHKRLLLVSCSVSVVVIEVTVFGAEQFEFLCKIMFDKLQLNKF